MQFLGASAIQGIIQCGLLNHLILVNLVKKNVLLVILLMFAFRASVKIQVLKSQLDVPVKQVFTD
jgi:hypothetical protein